MAQKLKNTLLIVCTALLLGSLMSASADAARRPSPTKAECASGNVQPNPEAAKDENAPARICVPLGSTCSTKTGAQCLKDNPIVKDLNTIVGFLSGLVGVVVVGVIILGGIQYALAGDKAEAVSAAKQRIVNGLIALVAFFFIFAFLQWLIPGGIFK
jgi:uncharacterized membrane protein YraQ (UPF0718 family)